MMPLLDVAHALGRCGDEVALLVPPSLSSAAADSGLTFEVGAQPPREVVDAIWERVRRGPPEQVKGLIDGELFADLATDAMLRATENLFARFRPDLIVREPCEYATAVVAYRSGIAQAQVGISQASIEAAVLRDVSARLERRCAGVTEAIEAAPYLTAFPPSLDPSPWPDTRRYRTPSPALQQLPNWWAEQQMPLVYITFGSVFGGLSEARSVYRVALDAVADLPVRALLTVGRAFDLESLGSVPANVHVERWVAQTDVFAAADLVICHGGSGTTYGALAAGLPLVVCPLFADQSANATIVERFGAGTVVRTQGHTGGALATLEADDLPLLREAIASTLHQPRFRQSALRIADEVSHTPTLEAVIDGLHGARS